MRGFLVSLAKLFTSAAVSSTTTSIGMAKSITSGATSSTIAMRIVRDMRRGRIRVLGNRRVVIGKRSIGSRLWAWLVRRPVGARSVNNAVTVVFKSQPHCGWRHYRIIWFVATSVTLETPTTASIRVCWERLGLLGPTLWGVVTWVSRIWRAMRGPHGRIRILRLVPLSIICLRIVAGGIRGRSMMRDTRLMRGIVIHRGRTLPMGTCLWSGEMATGGSRRVVRLLGVIARTGAVIMMAATSPASYV
jgi:hypothetical protein